MTSRADCAADVELPYLICTLSNPYLVDQQARTCSCEEVEKGMLVYTPVAMLDACLTFLHGSTYLT